MTVQTARASLAQLPVTLADIEAAAATLAGLVKCTNFDRSRTLSDITGASVWLKFENLQFTATFKERGALNRLSALSADQRRRGVIAASAGNHAQGVAYHAARLSIPATIYVPVGTPTVKIENTRRHGATVIEGGATLEEAAALATTHGRNEGLTFVHPYDDPLIIAGQGTIALEMLAAVPDLDVLIVPIGGGGLISGIAVAAKTLKPDIEVVGVQAALYPSMYNLIKHQSLPMRGDTLAEGIAVKAPGRITSEIVRALVDDIVLVTEQDVEHALSLLLTIEKSVTEGAGAAGLAAVLADPARFKGRKLGLVLSGGNIDTRLLSGVLTRQLAREGRLSQLRFDIVDRPGQLGEVVAVLSRVGANIVEVSHQRIFTDLPAKAVHLEIVVETRDRSHLAATIEALRAADLNVVVGAH
ncbi:threonine ammonia-lyase [Bradyrhizobium sp. KBS0727]|uniref:threonine ammonia-lyase n=1 Tax=unclassified Bradyrhizobium TaxID=2631580 RepID=UPI00110DF620|nr:MULTISPECIES: threonine ammonia-lyase [unclassified Bradyrhizobium]QDW40788.1 threonine ammonia-lyase [Bradyrhizobium sp. KBS0725]QDW47394.1 threonine ammonia-lyase [Bradyrhizobium sp. KBS0727]